jgi:hypothetical protein
VHPDFICIPMWHTYTRLCCVTRSDARPRPASVLSKQLADLAECLEGIKRWLGCSALDDELVQRWQQKTIRNQVCYVLFCIQERDHPDLNVVPLLRGKQGALLQLQDLLEWMSNCGFSSNGGWSPKTSKLKLKLANMRVVRASLMFIKIGNLVYDIFRLACTRFPKNAIAFERQMSLFDLHLGKIGESELQWIHE